MSEMLGEGNDELKALEAAVAEAEKIKKIVLKMLHYQGQIAFDASEAILDTDLEKRIKGKG